MKKFGQNLLGASLWIVGFGLMLASSGLDGAFLVKLMPAGFGWLGLVLNTTTDIASEVISYWTGRLAQDASKRKRTMSKLLWFAQFALVGFAWLFGWRQIIPILRIIEPQDFAWLAPLMAAFTPISLVAVGYTQALLAGKIESETVPAKAKDGSERQAEHFATSKPVAEQSEIEQNTSGSVFASSETLADSSEQHPLGLPFTCYACQQTFATQQALNAHKRKHSNGNGHKAEFERTKQSIAEK